MFERLFGYIWLILGVADIGLAFAGLQSGWPAFHVSLLAGIGTYFLFIAHLCFMDLHFMK